MFNQYHKNTPMETYKFSKLWDFVTNQVPNKVLRASVKVSALIMVLGLVIYYLTGFVWLVVFPFGFPVMFYIFFRTVVTLWEQIKMKRYCKKVGITIDKFNEMYKDVIKPNP